MTTEELCQWIQDGIPQSEAEASDLTGGGNHFEVTVYCPNFEGKTSLQRQRLVMDVLAPLFQGPLHAATIKTFPRRN